MPALIHPTAIVSPFSQMENSVAVGPFAIVEEQTHIGADTIIGAKVHVYAHTRIGKGCSLHDSCIVGNQPQDLKYGQEPTTLTIGDRTVIREFVTINRGTVSGGGKTIIGNDCLIMAYAHIAHDCCIGDHVVIANAVQLAGHVIIGDFAGIGGLVPVHQFVHIGKYAFIGGGFRVTQDVPPFALAAGQPLRFAGLNYTGLKRHGFTAEQQREIEQIYFILYQSRLTLQAALTRVCESFDLTGPAGEIVTFFEQSQRGVIRR